MLAVCVRCVLVVCVRCFIRLPELPCYDGLALAEPSVVGGTSTSDGLALADPSVVGGMSMSEGLAASVQHAQAVRFGAERGSRLSFLQDAQLAWQQRRRSALVEGPGRLTSRRPNSRTNAPLAV